MSRMEDFINGLDDVADKAEKLSEVKITPVPTATLDSVVDKPPGGFIQTSAA